MSTPTTETPREKNGMTSDELLTMPDDGFRYELVRGELKAMYPAGFFHGSTGMNLAVPLGQFIKQHGLGMVCLAETGFKISQNPDTVRAPDCAFVRLERIPVTGAPDGYFPGAPDLAVEVISPGDTVLEVEEKVAEWLDAGAVQVWIVNPKRQTVTIHSASGVLVLKNTDTLEGGELIPGFSLPVAEIFS